MRAADGPRLVERNMFIEEVGWEYERGGEFFSEDAVGTRAGRAIALASEGFYVC